MTMSMLMQTFECECDQATLDLSNVFAEFVINTASLEHDNMTGYVTEREASYLFEDAEETLQKNSQGILESIIKSIQNFFTTLAEKIRNFFTNKHVESKVEDLQRAAEDPQVANAKIELPDITTLTKAQRKYFDKVQAILNKKNAGFELTQKDLAVVEKFYAGEKEKSKAPILITVGAAIAAVTGGIMYCKNTENLKVKEFISAAKNKVNDATSKVTNNVKGKIQKAKDVEKNKKINAAKSEYSAVMSEYNYSGDQIKLLNEEIRKGGKEMTTTVQLINSNISAIERKVAELTKKQTDREPGLKKDVNPIKRAFNAAKDNVLYRGEEKKKEELNSRISELEGMKKNAQDSFQSKKSAIEKDRRAWLDARSDQRKKVIDAEERFNKIKEKYNKKGN